MCAVKNERGYCLTFCSTSFTFIRAQILFANLAAIDSQYFLSRYGHVDFKLEKNTQLCFFLAISCRLFLLLPLQIPYCSRIR